MKSGSQWGHAHVTNFGSKFTSSIIGSINSAIFLIKSNDLSSLDVYQTTASTLLFVEISNKNSAYKAVCVY